MTMQTASLHWQNKKNYFTQSGHPVFSPFTNDHSLGMFNNALLTAYIPSLPTDLGAYHVVCCEVVAICYFVGMPPRGHRPCMDQP